MSVAGRLDLTFCGSVGGSEKDGAAQQSVERAPDSRLAAILR